MLLNYCLHEIKMPKKVFLSFDHYILWTELKIANFDTRYTEVVKGVFLH